MNIMVTGATTPLGHGLIDALLADPRTTRILAVGGSGDAAWNDARVVYHGCDLRHARAIHDLLWGHARELAIDTVVHAMQHRAASDEGHRVHAQNVEATRELLLGAAHHPTLRRVVVRSFAHVYALAHATSELLDEDAPLDFAAAAPQWVRDRVEADLLACAARSGPLEVTVLRCAEIFAPDMGSQLWDYLQSRVCLRPLGFDPMLDVLSLPDAIAAFVAAVFAPTCGVFNIAGCDALPLSAAIRSAGRLDVPVPAPLLAPLYRWRRKLAGFDFHYDLNARRFHFGGVLDGERARTQLGYRPRRPVHWG